MVNFPFNLPPLFGPHDELAGIHEMSDLSKLRVVRAPSQPAGLIPRKTVHLWDPVRRGGWGRQDNLHRLVCSLPTERILRPGDGQTAQIFLEGPLRPAPPLKLDPHLISDRLKGNGGNFQGEISESGDDVPFRDGRRDPFKAEGGG